MNQTILEYLSGRVKFLENQISQLNSISRGGKTMHSHLSAMLIEAKMALSIAEGGKSILPVKND